MHWVRGFHWIARLGMVPTVKRYTNLNQGVFYFQNVLRFHGTRVYEILICALKEVGLFLAPIFTTFR